MKVYVLVCGYDSEIRGVFTSEEKADEAFEKIADEYKNDGNSHIEIYEIDELSKAHGEISYGK